MVAPIFGPINKDRNDPFSNTTKRVFTQAMPIDRPLPYTMYYYFGRRVDSRFTYPSSYTTTETKQADLPCLNDSELSGRIVNCKNLAYERLKSKLSDKAGWAENIAQIGKTRQSIIERSVQLARVVVELKHGEFRQAAGLLRTAVPSKVSNRKAVAQNLLEVEYGIKPLISDLQSSMQILTSFPAVQLHIVGRASDSIDRKVINRSSSDNGSQVFRNFDSTSTNLFCGVHLQAEATVTNPNLFLANQLGLIDLALPWKLIPFSFIVDWFVNVEQVISSVTDWYGVQLDYPATTVLAKGTRNIIVDNSEETWIGPGQLLTTGLFHRSFPATTVEVQRTMGISAPTLAVKPFRGFSIERAAQAISLVLSVLGK
jgi:hypothetical protein